MRWQVDLMMCHKIFHTVAHCVVMWVMTAIPVTRPCRCLDIFN